VQYLRERCGLLSEEGERRRAWQEEETGRLRERLEAAEMLLAERSQQRKEQPSSEPVDNYQRAYQSLLERYNALLSHNSHLEQEVRQLAQQGQSGQSETSELKRKNDQITEYYNKILIFSQEI
jgi:hypothetical protein